MNSRELVKAALRHEETERVPYFIQFTGDGAELLQHEAGDMPLEDFVDNDVKAFGPPWWTWHELAPEWRGPSAPTSRATVIGRGSYEGFVENVRRARETSDKYFLVTIYGSHFEKAYFSRGIENFLADMAAEPEFAKKLLTTIVDKNMVMLENFLALEEIDGVLLGSDWGSQKGLLMSPDVWEEMIRPGEQREYDLVHDYGKDAWVHSCGCIDALVPSLVEMGLDVLNPVQPECMDTAALKANFGDRLSFWGGISTQQTLPYGTPEEVREETRRVRDVMAAGGGYVLSPAQSIQGDVPLENMLALLEAAREPRAPGPAG